MASIGGHDAPTEASTTNSGVHHVALSTKRRTVAIIGAGVGSLLAVSGCSAISGALGADPVITVSPAPQGAPAPASEPVTVKVEHGKLTDVAVKTGAGKRLVGSMNAEQTVWTSNADSLKYGTRYAVKAEAEGNSGKPTLYSESFKTVNPDQLVTAQFAYFSNGATVGVGMPARIEFSSPVKNRAEVEKRLRITASNTVVGAWSWDKDRTAVTFRPETYWPAKTKVSIEAPLKGVELSPGTFGTNDLNGGFSTGSATILTVNAATHQLRVVRDGKLVRKIPVTTGKSGFETRSGIVPIMAKEGTVVMDAASGGTPQGSSEYYRLTVNYSMRITPSGEYLHAAPWSEGSQGYANTSHGCVGMSTTNASWLFDYAKVGDVVVVKNTGRQQDLGNGITQWNVSWDKWLARSETGPQTIGPDGASSTAA